MKDTKGEMGIARLSFLRIMGGAFEKSKNSCKEKKKMNSFGKKVMKALAAVCAAAVLAAAMMLAGCGAREAEGSASIDAQLTAANSTMMPAQVSSMVGGTTQVSVKVEGDAYTVTKTYSSPDSAESAENPVAGEGFSFVYTFTGSVTSSDGDTYVLAPATACDYTVSWGFVSGVVGGFMELPVEDGSGDETSDPDCLNYFYGPYVAKSENKAMTVTIADGGLVFEGFSIVPEV